MYKSPNAVFKFIRAERSRGTSFKKDKENGIPYDFGTIRVSDQHDSFNIDVDPELVDQLNSQFKKGDFIEVTYEVGERFRNTTYTVVDYSHVYQEDLQEA